MNQQCLSSSILAVEAKNFRQAQGADGFHVQQRQRSLVESAVAALVAAAAAEDEEIGGAVLRLLATAPELVGLHALGRSLLQQ